MPLPDWTPIMFVEPAAVVEASPESPEAPDFPPVQRPSEPLLPGRWAPQSAPGMALTPERWTPPPMTLQSGSRDAPVGPVRWPSATPATPQLQPQHVTPGVHIVMPSNDTSL